MSWVFDELTRLGIGPSPAPAAETTTVDGAFRDAIVRRAWGIMGELGWFDAQSISSEAAPLPAEQS